MTVTRQNYRIGVRIPYNVIRALEELGLDYRRDENTHYHRRQPSFWLREEANLHYILTDARAGWLRLMKTVHPDKIGGDTRLCAYVNAVWDRAEYLFRKKGITLCD